jgi:hypothetical protein
MSLRTVTLVEVELSSGTKKDVTMNVQQDQALTQKMEPASHVNQVAIFVIFKTRPNVSDVLNPELYTRVTA